MKFRKKPIIIEAYQTKKKEMDIETLEGVMHASIGDYIITGVNGEQYPCKPDIFEKTYEPVEDDLDESVDNFLTRVYTDLLHSWENTHKDASENNIIPYEIQEINPDKER